MYSGMKSVNQSQNSKRPCKDTEGNSLKILISAVKQVFNRRILKRHQIQKFATSFFLNKYHTEVELFGPKDLSWGFQAENGEAQGWGHHIGVGGVGLLNGHLQLPSHFYVHHDLLCMIQTVIIITLADSAWYDLVTAYNRKSAPRSLARSLTLCWSNLLLSPDDCSDDITFPYGEYYCQKPSVRSSYHPLEHVTVGVYVYMSIVTWMNKMDTEFKCMDIARCTFCNAAIITSVVELVKASSRRRYAIYLTTGRTVHLHGDNRRGRCDEIKMTTWAYTSISLC